MRVLKRIWTDWKRIGMRLGDLVARVVLTMIYFTIVLPFGISVRWLADPLDLHPSSRGWHPRRDPEPSFDQTRKQI